MVKLIHTKWLWLIFFIGLILLFNALAYFIILPAYRSPDSRIWSTSIGYPTLLRWLNKPIPVQTAMVSKRTMQNVVSADGLIRYLNEIPINVELPGIIEDITVQAGSDIEQGQLLMTLNTGGHRIRMAKLELEIRKTEYIKSKNDYYREKNAYDKGLIALTVFQGYERIYQNAEIAMQKAHEAYEESLRSRSKQVHDTGIVNKDSYSQSVIEILAPLTGRVLRIHAFIGENLIRPRNTVMTLGDKLVFQATIDQHYFSWLKTNDKATIYLRALPGQEIEGKVIRIAPEIMGKQDLKKTQQPSYTFFTWFEIDQSFFAKHRIAPGMNGYCVLRYPFESLVIPEKALIRYSGGKGLVLSINSENKIEINEVTYSISSEGWVAITHGLNEKTQVIVSGQRGLKYGDKVQLK